MLNKFSTEELIIRIMPGGFLITVIFFVFGNSDQLKLASGLDFVYSFLFFCSAFIIGELLQTIAHEMEWMIDIFFKCRRPSEVFLYRNNPVLKNETKRKEILKKVKLKEMENTFEIEYSKLSFWWWKKSKREDKMSQGVFWKLYTQVSDSDEIKISNRNYLFSRVIMIEFLIMSTLFFLYKNTFLGIIGFISFLLYLWRSRGMARGLVFKTVLLNLKGK